MSETSTRTTEPGFRNDGGVKLQTTVPSDIRRRGDANGTSGSVASTLRGPRSTTTSISETLPDGWIKVKHPESGAYYVHQEKGLSTFADVCIPKIYALVMQCAGILRTSPAFQAISEDGHNVELVLDVPYRRSGSMMPSYYCLSHTERRILWLEGIGHEEVDVPCTSNKCTVVESSGSRAHCIEAQYWKHCELFPVTFTVTKEIIRNLKDILLQAAADRLVAKFSTSPYDKQDLGYMLNLLKEIEADMRESNGHAAWIVARFMALHNDGVLHSLYGQSDDYFDIEDTEPIFPYERPNMLAILAPFLFRTPDLYAEELHSIHEGFTLRRWSNFVHKVDQSIRDSNLLATVLLFTDAEFLIWANDGKTSGNNTPTPEQIVTYISIISSVGSIIIGLAIFKHYRAKGADTPLRAVVVLKRILKEPFGLERLAIICSLPYVLLMWGLIAFWAAFGIVFYRQTGIQVRIPVTLALSIIVLCLFFCYYTAGSSGREDPEALRQFREHTDISYSKMEA